MAQDEELPGALGGRSQDGESGRGGGSHTGRLPNCRGRSGVPLEEADFLQNKGGTLLCRSGDPGRGWGKERQGAGEAA